MKNDRVLLESVAICLVTDKGTCEECGHEEHHANCPIGRIIATDDWNRLREIRSQIKTAER